MITITGYTIEDIKKQLELENLKDDKARKTEFKIPQVYPGELYAGLKLDADTGKPVAHVVLMAIADKWCPWKEQKEWAASVGGKLPDHQDSALLFANLKHLFKDAWYWLDPEYSAGYAWTQDFGNGGQNSTYKGIEAFAVAVRLIPIKKV